MSLRRRVRISIELPLAGAQTLDLKLPGILPPRRMAGILGGHLLGDGWEAEGDRIVRRSDTGADVYDPAAGTVTVEMEREVRKSVATVLAEEEDEGAARRELVEAARRGFTDELEQRIGEVRGEFLRKYVPSTVADAVVEKARALDPDARVTRTETDGELVVSIELEATP